MTVYEAMQIFAVIFPVMLTLFLHWVTLGYQAKINKDNVKHPIKEKAYETLVECLTEINLLLDSGKYEAMDYLMKYQQIMFKTVFACQTINPEDKTIFQFTMKKITELVPILAKYEDKETELKLNKIVLESLEQMGTALNTRVNDTLR